jgi:hypothetical protein
MGHDIYNTSLVLKGFPDFSGNNVVPTPLTAYLALSPSSTYSREFSSVKLVSDLCDPVI